MTLKTIAPTPLLAALCCALFFAGAPPVSAQSAASADQFPSPVRPVASIVSSHSGEEADRERDREADQVMNFLNIAPGMTIADIGAGDGYFTVRLARRVGPSGRVIATDVVPEHLARLRARVAQEGLSNVDFELGTPEDPALPAASVDVALLVRMYHEIEQPYAFMWRLRDALKPGGVVAISERERATQNHGTPVRMLTCEIEAVGYKRQSTRDFGTVVGYVAIFGAQGKRPAPSDVRACRA